MSTFGMYKEYEKAKTVGMSHQVNSDIIENATWWNAIESRVGYFYDFYSDLESDEPLKLRDLHPEEDVVKVPIDIKYFRHTSQTMDKDRITYHLRFRPHQKCTVPYYNELYGDVYNSLFPVGLYVDIKDADGKYNKWLVAAPANFYDMQFPSFEILPCDKVFRWIHEGKKYKMAGVLRSQNSYNSGIWTDYKLTSVEDQQKLLLPLNKLSEKIWYDLRVIIDNEGSGENFRAWKVSKVNRVASNGTAIITFAQDQFDEHKDYIEYDENGKIIGVWGDYYKNGVPATDSNEPDPISKYVKMSYKGVQNFQLKVGGSARTFTVQYFNPENEPIDYVSGDWAVTMDGESADKFISLSPVSDGEVKVKVIGDDSLIGKECTITFQSIVGPNDSITMNISGL